MPLGVSLNPRFPRSQAPLIVLGDLILDRYIWGEAERISPEAPVPVLRADREEIRLGGAASVAALLRGLDSHVILAGVVGNDTDGTLVKDLLRELNINSDVVIESPDRCTTSKQRFVGRAANRHAHQILRVDRESRETVPPAAQQELIDGIQKLLPQAGAVLIADYGKGVCTPEVLRSVIQAARRADIPVIVDPARLADYATYHGASLIKPNRTEAELLSGRRITSPTEAQEVARDVLRRFELGAVLITLDREGMLLVLRDGTSQFFATRPRAVYDITGAGDMALAMVGLCLANGFEWDQSIMLANAAAGLEVERFGVTAVSWREIEVELSQRSITTKISNLDQLATLRSAYRDAGRRVVFTNGCFDLLHVGHLTCLQQAAALGDILFVGINSDASVRRLKGSQRPVINENDRACLVAGLECVNHVIVFEQDTPRELLKVLKPDVLVKGGTYDPDQVVGKEIVEAYGGLVTVVGVSPGVSTTTLLDTIRSEP